MRLLVDPCEYGIYAVLKNMHVENWKIDNVKPYPRNARKIPEKAVAKVATSLAEFGWKQPLVVDPQGVVIVGHTRLLAAKKLGYGEVPVLVASDLSAAKARAYRLMDNRSHDETDWDLDVLNIELADLKLDDIDLQLTGFDLPEIERSLAVGRDDEAANGAPGLPETPVSRLGDLWILGNHRLLCGDATSAEDVARVLGGAKVRLVVTSPPYNQKIDSFKPSGMHKEGNWIAKVERLAYADSMPESDYQHQQSNLLKILHDVMADDGSLFYNHKNRYRDKRVVTPYEWLPGPFTMRQEIIWSRPGSVTQNARMFLPSDERIFWMYKGENFVFNDSTEIKSWSTVWEVNLETNKTHAVGFPVELPRRCIRASSKSGDPMMDPFMGSGTTLIAAEQTGRVCYGLEIDPKYCDVIVRRWQTFTGKSAGLEDGRTFEQVAADRGVTLDS